MYICITIRAMCNGCAQYYIRGIRLKEIKEYMDQGLRAPTSCRLSPVVRVFAWLQPLWSLLLQKIHGGVFLRV